MIETPRIVETQAREAAVIRITVPRADIVKVMGPAIAEVMGTVAAQGRSPAGPVFSHHFRMDPEVFDFEVGVPVSGPVAATGRVRPGMLPAVKEVACTVYHGGYEGLGSAWGELSAWMEREGHAPAAELWECYVRGPESGPDPAQWRTELNRPLRR